VRVAIIGLEDGGSTATTARRVLRVLLADPLSDQQAWEEQLSNHDPAQPLIVRLGPSARNPKLLTTERKDAVQELNISAPALNGLKLEILFTNSDTQIEHVAGASVQAAEDAILCPLVHVSHTNAAASPPVATPVHKALLVGTGLSGALKISTLPAPVLESEGNVLAAANMDGLSTAQVDAQFRIVDVTLAEKAIELFRKGPQHAMEYEKLWFASRVPDLMKWLKAGAASYTDETKPVVKQLIASILQSTMSSIQAEEARKLSQALMLKNLPESEELNAALAAWAEAAHAELQGELDLAFAGRRWRQINWWKLFWRVDDVAMLTNEMLSQRFLPTAEQELVYLTGRIAGPKGQKLKYPQPRSSHDAKNALPEARKLGSGELAPPVAASGLPKWPGHIAFTRRYLQNETIPALQALAQRLVAQSLGTSGIASSLAALLYVSSFASTLYEAGAYAAIGIVYGLARMQKKWETARGFWEGEVREEGRKAVRAAEESVAKVLQGDKVADEAAGGSSELQRAQGIIAKAEDALARLK
jgi:hypothetical protein